jgi:hypothetical protein
VSEKPNLFEFFRTEVPSANVFRLRLRRPALPPERHAKTYGAQESYE